MHVNQVEIIAASLVREYLSRKGLRTTLQILDEEFPRSEGSINNRTELAAVMHIEKMMKLNKEREQPHSTMIEVMTNFFCDACDVTSRQSVSPPVSSPASSQSSTQLSTRQSETSVRAAGSDANGRLTENRLGSEVTAKTRRGHASEGQLSCDLVLEDSVGESETRLGNGKSNLMTSLSVTVSPPVGTTERPRPSRHRGMAGLMSTGLKDRDRIRSGRERGQHSARSKFDVTDVDRHASSLADVDARTLSQKPSELSVAARGRQSSSSEILVALERGIRQRGGDAKPSRHAPPTAVPVDCTYDAKLSSISSETPARRAAVAVTSDALKLTTATAKVVTGDALKATTATAKPATAKSATAKSAIRPAARARQSSMEIDDIEDDGGDDGGDTDLRQMLLSRQPPLVAATATAVDARPIDVTTAVELKKLILGGASEQFNSEWRQQSFSFCDIPELQYGIVQKKGGSCGILAAVQAAVLQELLFNDNNQRPLTKCQCPSRPCRSAALAAALARVLWRSAELGKHTAIVTLSGQRAQYQCSSKCRSDGLTETLTLYHFTSYNDLLAFLKQNVSQFEADGSSGVILALYSAILSHTIAEVRSDMDEPTNKLMGAHGYCTQEMVNLFLGGRARSNVFNDTIRLDEDSETATLLKGVDGRSDIGLLSLFEYYRSCQVGTYLKTPRFPIWVVCSESHFSVLFCLKRELLTDWKAERRFDLFYYDGLARQSEPIVLTVSTTNRHYTAPPDGELTPPLELCIRTKWPDAEIDWNSTEPLL